MQTGTVLVSHPQHTGWCMVGAKASVASRHSRTLVLMRSSGRVMTTTRTKKVGRRERRGYGSAGARWEGARLAARNL